MQVLMFKLFILSEVSGDLNRNCVLSNTKYRMTRNIGQYNLTYTLCVLYKLQNISEVMNPLYNYLFLSFNLTKIMIFKHDLQFLF